MNDVYATLIAAGGWIGAAELLAAYALVSRGTITGDSLRYQALNITGSALLVINCVASGAWPSAATNFIYLLLGMFIVMTVKRAYIGQLAKRHGSHVRTRIHASGPYQRHQQRHSAKRAV